MALAPVALSQFVNFADPATIKEYLDPEILQNPDACNQAFSIAKKIYETNIRHNCANTGIVFPAYPEVLAWAMKESKGATVLGVGGAAGELEILCTLAGAKEAFLNEIDAGEIALFEKQKQSLPKPIAARLHSLQGDCLNLLDQHPELIGKIDLIFCRNVLHFFNTKQQTQFFEIAKKLLKTEAKMFLSVTSSAEMKLSKINPPTHFQNIQCVFYDYLNNGGTPIHAFAVQRNPVGEEEFAKKFTKLYPYDRNLGGKWIENKDAWKQLSPGVERAVKDEIKEKKIGSIKYGAVAILVSYSRAYEEQSLSDLCAEHGFNVLSTRSFQLNGHLLSEDSISSQVGVFVQKISEETLPATAAAQP